MNSNNLISGNYVKYLNFETEKTSTVFSANLLDTVVGVIVIAELISYTTLWVNGLQKIKYAK